jgi:hypothetical protein
MNLIDPQPDPILNNNPSIHDLVCCDIQARKAFGLEKYGVPLQAGNGRKSIIDLYQELLDAVCYGRIIIEEMEALEGFLDELRAFLEQLATIP